MATEIARQNQLVSVAMAQAVDRQVKSAQIGATANGKATCNAGR